jgi:molybdopterin converting factor small subunit
MFKRGLKKKITVKIKRDGQDVEEIKIKEGATVAELLDAAGMHKKDTESIRVNQANGSVETKLKDGDRVVLAKNIAGGGY